MAYPTTPLTVVIEFWDGTQWVDITSYVLVRDGIHIRRGFPDEGSSPEPGSMTLTLNNRDGRFSPRNPTSPYYELIGRNTPIRVRIDESFIAAGDQVRFVGEVSEWPARWDISGKDVWVPITAQGILRRLGQGSRPIRSPLRVAIAAISDVVAYWPAEDEGGQFSSAIPGQPAVTVAGDVDFASVDHLVGSAPLPSFTDTTAVTGSMNGQFTDRWFFTWLISILAVPATEVTLIEIFTSGGSADRWELKADSTTLTFTGYSASGSVVHTDTSTSSKLLGGNDQGWIGLQMFAVDADIAGLTIFDLSTTSTVGCQVISGSIVAGTVTGFRIPADSELDGVPMGHFAVFNAVTPDGVLIPNGPEPANAFDGETAAARAERLADNASIAFTFIGTAGDTELMGPEATPATFLDAFNETWQADLALVYETRDEIGLSWRTRRSLYSQTVALELDYEGSGEIANLEPTDDDQHVVNDVEVKRKGGGSARAEDSTSLMGTQAPPDGIGRYDEQVEVSLFSDEQCLPQAAWRLHVGHWDALRYPVVGLNMAALAKNGKTSLMGNIAAVDVGARVQITNLPDWLPPDDVDLLALGLQERIGHPVDWDIALVCRPGGPYDVGTLAADTDAGRLNTRGCTTAEALDTTETGVDVTNTDSGWSSTAVPYDITIGGERMTVTAVSGTGTSQTLTVTRSVNGVVKSHSTAATVRLVRPLRLVL